MSEPAITIPTPDWNHGGAQPAVRWVVLHDEEYPVRDTSAEEVAAYFRDKPVGEYGSAHYVTDADSEQHCVSEALAAYHAPNLSFMGSVGIEQDGYARFSRADWLTPGSKATIARTAARTAELCKRWGIPARYVNAAGLNAGANGITSHYEVNHSAYGATDHWDPGYNFPWTEFMELVGWGLIALQDVPAFQRAQGLAVDGDAGIKTVLALGTFLGQHWPGETPPPPAPVPAKPKTGLHRYDGCPMLEVGAQDNTGFKTGRAYDPKDWPVHALQAALNGVGVPPLTNAGALKVDGAFGAYTGRTVRTYQQARGLVVDGEVGPATWLSLAKKLTDLSR